MTSRRMTADLCSTLRFPRIGKVNGGDYFARCAGSMRYTAPRSLEQALIACPPGLPHPADPSRAEFLLKPTEQEAVAFAKLVRAAERRLALLSKDETRFLNLFSDDELPRPDVRESWLPDRVYQAAQSLLKGDLVERAVIDGRERFCLTDAAAVAFTNSREGVTPKRLCLDLDLSAVEGTRASGGGARGSY